MADMMEQARLLREVRLALQNEDYPVAIKNLKEAARLAAQSGDLGMESRHLGNLALIYHRLQRPDKALDYFRRALSRARKEGDRATEDGLLGNMGNILRELGRYDDAMDFLNQALIIAQEIGDVRGRGIWLGNLGLVYDDLGEHERAIDYHEESIAIARELQDRRGLAQRLGNIGNTYVSMGDYLQALRHFQESVEIYHEIGDRQSLALRMGIMGNIYAEIGRRIMPHPEAFELFQAALDHYTVTTKIAREFGDTLGEADLLRSAGGVLETMGLYDQAIRHYSAAEHLYMAMGMDDRVQMMKDSIAANLRQMNSGG